MKTGREERKRMTNLTQYTTDRGVFVGKTRYFIESRTVGLGYVTLFFTMFLGPQTIELPNGCKPEEIVLSSL